MKSKYYKNYRTCKSCGNELPLNPQFYRRNLREGHYIFHLICKDCENVIKKMPEWKDGKLLCHRCREYKDEVLFTSNNTTNSERHFRRHICNKCNAERQREHDIELDSDIKLVKCLRFRFLGARDRAIKNNIPFNLELQYIIDLWNSQNGICALSGLPMTFELKQGRVPTNVSIDKIDRTLGYTKGNIQLVCMACNQIKSDLTELEMYNFCKNIVKQYESKNNINTNK